MKKLAFSVPFVLFSEGRIWNGLPQPYAAQLKDLVAIEGYEHYEFGHFNGANVLLRDGSRFLLYFVNWKDPGRLYWAQSESPRNFRWGGIALQTSHAVNDVEKFSVQGKDWYLMALHANGPRLWHSLSNDGLQFGPERDLFANLGDEDRYIVAAGLVRRRDRLLGVLYGAGPVAALNQNRIFAGWLQKRLVLVGNDGTRYQPEGALSWDRQRFKLPQGDVFEGVLEVYAEDGVSLLSKLLVKLESEKIYRLSSSGL